MRNRLRLLLVMHRVTRYMSHSAFASGSSSTVSTMSRSAITTEAASKGNAMNNDMILVSHEPVHPGEFLREDYMPELGFTVATLAGKPCYNGFACGHGAHGPAKCSRARAKQAR